MPAYHSLSKLSKDEAEHPDHVEGSFENEEVQSERCPSIGVPFLPFTNVYASEHFKDSITHPYRSMLEDTSFPRCHLTLTPAGRTETYTRSMLGLGNGLPIWDPLGNINRPEKHIKSGVSIGDVGVLDKDGDFECFFNVFLPKTDETQRMCPPDMVPLLPAPEPAEIATDMNYFPPGTTLVSEGFQSTELNTSPLHIKFQINAREGGILVLPHGASREDLISTIRLREYVQQHALSWYTFMNEKVWPDIHLPNGSLYVVTGCDKAPSWAIAAADPQCHQANAYPLSIEFHGDSSPVWKTNSGIRRKSTKAVDDSQKYSVFLRGMKIAIGISDWTTYVLHNEPPSKIPFYNVLTIPNTGLRARYQSFIERHKRFPRKYMSQETRYIFHPSEILLRFMLEEFPSSHIAIVEDTMLTANYQTIVDGCVEHVVNFLLQILTTHDIVNDDGLTILVSKKPVSREVEASSKLRLLFAPMLLQNWYRNRRQRRETLAKLHKIFPGSPVPLEDLKEG